MMRHPKEFVIFIINLQHTNFKAFKLLLICAPYLCSIFWRIERGKGEKWNTPNKQNSEITKWWRYKIMGKKIRKFTFKNLCDSKG
jgi:hypothetical protein